MLNKLFIILSSITFILLFTVMILLISIALLDPGIGQKKIFVLSNQDKVEYKITNQVSNDDEVISDDFTSVNIKTDKNVYNKNEKVVVSFINKAESTITQNVDSNITISSRHDLGKNSEIAFIEQLLGEVWVAIEPLKRCSKKCNEICDRPSQVQAKKTELFEWPQSLIICNEKNGEIIKESANPGSYRIVSAAWNKKQEKYAKVYSNIFTISNLSKY